MTLLMSKPTPDQASPSRTHSDPEVGHLTVQHKVQLVLSQHLLKFQNISKWQLAASLPDLQDTSREMRTASDTVTSGSHCQIQFQPLSDAVSATGLTWSCQHCCGGVKSPLRQTCCCPKDLLGLKAACSALGDQECLWQVWGCWHMACPSIAHKPPLTESMLRPSHAVAEQLQVHQQGWICSLQPPLMVKIMNLMAHGPQLGCSILCMNLHSHIPLML